MVVIDGDPGSGHPFVDIIDTSRGIQVADAPYYDPVHPNRLLWDEIYLQGFTPPSAPSVFGARLEAPANQDLVAGTVVTAPSGTGIAYFFAGSTEAGCNRVGRARYVIDQIDGYDSTDHRVLRARFDQTCLDSPAELRGCMFLDSSVVPDPGTPMPDGGLFDLGPLPTDGGMLGSPEDCAGDNTFYIKGSPGDVVNQGVWSIGPAWGSAWAITRDEIPAPSSAQRLALHWGTVYRYTVVTPETDDFKTDLSFQWPVGSPSVGTLYVSRTAPAGPGIINGAAAIVSDFATPTWQDPSGGCVPESSAFQLQTLRTDSAGFPIEVAATFVGHCAGANGGYRGCVHVNVHAETGGVTSAGPIEWVRHFPSDQLANGSVTSLRFDGGALSASVKLEMAANAGFGEATSDSAIRASYDADGGNPLATPALPKATGVADNARGDVAAVGKVPDLADAGIPLIPVDGGMIWPDEYVGELNSKSQWKWARALPYPDPDNFAITGSGDVLAVFSNAYASYDIGCGGLPVQEHTTLMRLSGVDGHCLWWHAFADQGSSKLLIQVDSDESTYVIGSDAGGPDLGCGVTGQFERFIAKLDSAGRCVWMKLYDRVSGLGRATMTSDGDLLIGGFATGPLDQGCPASPMGNFLAKLSPVDGHCVWITALQPEPGTFISLFMIAPDLAGGALLATGGSVFEQSVSQYMTDGTLSWTLPLHGFSIEAAAQNASGKWVLGGAMYGIRALPGVRVVSGNGGTAQDPVLLQLR